MSLFFGANPLSYDTTEANQTVFFDDANQDLFVVKTDESALSVVAKSCRTDIVYNFRLDKQGGPIKTIKFSPNRSVLAVQRGERQSVEFVNLNRDRSPEKIEYSQTCREKNCECIRWFLWTSSEDVVFLTNRGLEFYRVVAEKHLLRSTRTSQCEFTWYLWHPESRLLLLASGDSSSVFSVYKFNENGTIRKNFAPFKVLNERPWAAAAAGPGANTCTPQAAAASRLGRKDCQLVSLYGRNYVAVMVHGRSCTEIDLYQLADDGLIRRTDTLVADVGGPVALSLADDLVLVHCQAAKKTLLFDVNVRENVVNGVYMHRAAVPAQSFRPVQVRTYGGLVDCQLYSPRWVFYAPNVLVDPNLRHIWLLKLDLNECVRTLFQNMDSLTAEETSSKGSELAESGVSDRKASLNMETLERFVIFLLGRDRALPNLFALIRETVRRLCTIEHPTFTLGHVRRAFEVVNDVCALKASQISSQAGQQQQRSMFGSSSTSTASAVPLNVAVFCRSAVDKGNVIAQRMMMSEVFGRLLEEKDADPASAEQNSTMELSVWQRNGQLFTKRLTAITMTYINSLVQRDIYVEHLLDQFVMQNLIEHGRMHHLLQYIQHHTIESSVPTACSLLSTNEQSAAQIALDMLKRHEPSSTNQIIDALLARGQVITALRLAVSKSLVDKVSCRPFLDAALKNVRKAESEIGLLKTSGQISSVSELARCRSKTLDTFFYVFTFFEDRNYRLIGDRRFPRADHCEEFERFYHQHWSR